MTPEKQLAIVVTTTRICIVLLENVLRSLRRLVRVIETEKVWEGRPDGTKKEA